MQNSDRCKTVSFTKSVEFLLLNDFVASFVFVLPLSAFALTYQQCYVGSLYLPVNIDMVVVYTYMVVVNTYLSILT